MIRIFIGILLLLALTAVHAQSQPIAAEKMTALSDAVTEKEAPDQATEQAIMPKPYTATYAVKYRGFKLGSLVFTLRPAQDGTYIYETQAKPGFIARFLVSPDAVERTVVVIDAAGVRPLHWISEDGTEETEDDGYLAFDWKAQRVTGIVEDKVVDIPTEDGIQDRLSMQVAVLMALQRGRSPGPVKMIAEDRIKQYNYVKKGTRSIDSAVGRYQTILYESTRPGSSHLKKIYHAPKLGYLPVRLENFRKGDLETVMELIAVTPPQDSPPELTN
ncbi:MAG: DUF3108 domain-containing protein [Desulfuromonadales bacterium]